MCILNTDAAEGPKNLGALTGDTAQRYFHILQLNLAEHVTTRSIMLYTCWQLSKPHYFQHENYVLQADINTILYTLSKKSAKNAVALAHTFCMQDYMLNITSVSLFDAFALSVPKIDIDDDDIQEVLDCCVNVLYGTVLDHLKQRYAKQASARFSEVLKYAVWKIESEVHGIYAVHVAWWRAESAQRHFHSLQSNLARERFTVQKSAMLQVCCALSQPAFFQKTDLRLEADIETILYLLCEESAKNPKKLAQTFSVEDEKIVNGETTLLAAFGECVPKIDYDPMQKILMQTILVCLPNVQNCYNKVIGSVACRYRKDGINKFSGSLRDILKNWKRCPNPECTPKSQTAALYTDPGFVHLEAFILEVLEEDSKDVS
ncbi:MAG: hypothetical protein OXC30_05040 [Alphaproteobacteria bacterium]|nr:hypothetical protein [Alphaproteobacteria bacterium]